MAVPKELSSAKRFGPRYGRTLRNKLSKVESQHKGKKKCPFCTWQKLKRLAAGIWQCDKCDKKFAAKAYSPKVQR
ncbi:50S ribosomal protein L37ae [Candidatus Woesearchaeota archaeon]|jgi:large subunit ribosomal protein L37Ae|nr:50S ribosomal protein L37ae [Candidatus Woesearchaeota archaeon]MBT3537969.1 50S ribosomal protein L37ae [Candidatus Woesearchaeota archaeon]MBT4697324.1 50S ribosomal protein L37ae [Candidatus Woesearchaeota archaeon]MBT4717044.1 50S ribosomal protein L37ae [Candidatus Woesearchaeota archaeon]MBT7105638.1 50S ribosomal protein L37ae [Candidatus Woesearchaeota archaeon]